MLILVMPIADITNKKEKTTLDIIFKAIGSLDDSYRDVCRLKYLHQKNRKRNSKIIRYYP